NRTGADGKPRELHVAKAADVLDYRRGVRGAVATIDYHFEGLDRTALVADPRFTVERVLATGEAASIATDNRPLIVMALERGMNVRANDVDVSLERYQTALIPAAVPWCTVRAGDGAPAPFMLVTPPASPAAMPVRLLAAGIDRDAVDRFMEQFA